MSEENTVNTNIEESKKPKKATAKKATVKKATAKKTTLKRPPQKKPLLKKLSLKMTFFQASIGINIKKELMSLMKNKLKNLKNLLRKILLIHQMIT